jgi:hypothetical protein
MTVRDFLGIVNHVLGGGSSTYSADELDIITQDTALAFDGGAPSTFAQDHLVNGACP